MSKKDIQILYEYNHWADDRILAAASALTEEQFIKDLSSSYCSMRDTLVHILSAEWIWLMRWKGISPKVMLNPADFPNINVLKVKWAEVKKDQANFLNKVTDESLAKMITYVNTLGVEYNYSLGQMMQHVVNHSSYHRGQVTTMLRQLGAAAVPTDFLIFIDMQKETA